MTDTAPGQSGDKVLPQRTIMVVMIGLVLGSMLASLDQMIVTSMLRTVADRLHGLTLQAWGITAYMTTSVISAPLYGKLSDLYGRKPLYVISISLFMLGSLLTAMSPSMYALAAFRGIQGLGSGGLMALAFAILADLLPQERRAAYQAFFSVVFGVCSVIGPFLGGFFAGLNELLGIDGWRWAFLINIPIGVAALILVVTGFELPHTRTERRIDYAGAAMLVVGLVPLLIVAEQGRDWGWGSAASITLLVLGGLGLVAFVLVERAVGDAALLSPRLFRNPMISMSNAVNFVVGMGVFGVLGVLPLYLQLVRGLSPTAAGLMLLPQAGGVILAGRVCGPLIARIGHYKWFLVPGLGAMLAGSLLYSRLAVDTSLWRIALIGVVVGLGIGVCFQAVLVAIQNCALPADMGAASASYMFFRSVGGTAGATIYLSILFALAGGRVTSALRAAAGDPGFQAALNDPATTNPALRDQLRALSDGSGRLDLDNSAFLNHIDARLAHPILTGLTSSMDTAFLASAGVLFVGLLTALLLKGKLQPGS